MTLEHPAAQHSVNAIVASAPFVSVWAKFPETVTVVVGCLAAIYYVLVIGEKLGKWYTRWVQFHQSAKRVGAALEEERHGASRPGLE